MGALLGALADDPDVRAGRRVRLAVVLTITAAGAILATWGLVGRQHALDPCASAAGELRGAWDASRRAAIERRFTESPSSYARDTFTRVAAGLDGYAEAG